MGKKQSKNIRILLADDHPIVREGIRSSLEDLPRIEIVGEAATGEETVALVRKLRPDVVLLDISMPGMGGAEALKALLKEAPETKVLVLSMHDRKEYITGILRAGARGYVLKDSPPGELARAVETVYRGDAFFSPGVSRVLLQDYVGDPEKESASRQDGLSPREREVLTLVARGLTNKEIARDLFLSVRTVETHRENLMRKLDIYSIAGLTKFAIAHGLAEAD